MSQDVRRALGTAAIGSKLLLTHCLAYTARVMPARAAFLNGAGTIAGAAIMLRERRKWDRLLLFARQFRLPVSGTAFLLRHYVQKGRDLVWGAVYPEVPGALDRKVRINDVQALRQTLASGSGAIILGIHYGPNIGPILLSGAQIPLRWVIGEEAAELIREKVTRVPMSLVTEKVRYFADPANAILSGKGERSLVRHVLGGGAVLMLTDALVHPPAGSQQHFVGAPWRISLFPYRLALQHNVPVFLMTCSVNRDGYVFSIEPCEHFASPEEGARKVLSHFEALIHEYPYSFRTPDVHVPDQP